MVMQLGGPGAVGEGLGESGAAEPRSAAPERRKPGRATREEERAAYVFLSPWIAGFVFFLLVPLLWAIWLSFTDEQLLRPGQFIGLQNYVRAFTDDPSFYKALQVTLTWIVI